MAAATLAVEMVDGEGAGADAAPVLVAHGLFGQGRNWMTPARRFAAARPTAVADLRNHGASPWSDAMDYAVMGADLAEAARRAFGRPTILLGHSMGGKAAMAAALAGDPIVRAVGVVDIAPVAYGSGRGDDHGAFVGAMQAVDLSKARRRRDVEDALAATVESPAIRAFLVQNLEMSGPDGPRWRLNLDAIAAALPALMGWPEDLARGRYDGPAFFLAGGASAYVDAAGEAAIRAQFPNADIARIDGAGHWLHAERPEETADRLSAWMAKLS